MGEGRFELKYALPRTRRVEVLRLARPHVVPGAWTDDLSEEPDLALAPDEPPAHGYRVHSLYLDTPQLDGYGRRLDRVDIRNRVRARTYGRPGQRAPVFLESKRKLYDQVVKHRVRIGSTRDWESAASSAGGRGAPWERLVATLPAGEGRRRAERWVAAARGMVPVCSTHYLREVYEALPGSANPTARLTLDHRVRGRPGDDPGRLQHPGEVALLPADWFVLELKFNDDMPGWMRGMVAAMRLSAEPVSKFALGVARTARADEPRELRAVMPRSLLAAGIVFDDELRADRLAPASLAAR